MLHDPHAEVRLSSCVSALKILTAARAILDFIYSIYSTSFDITLLDSFCSVCHDFFTPSKHPPKQNIFSSVGSLVVGSLLGFYRLPWHPKILTRYPHCEGSLTFYSEPYSYLTISAKSKILCSMAIAKLGQRIPLAYKFARMLEDLIIKDCGATFQYPS